MRTRFEQTWRERRELELSLSVGIFRRQHTLTGAPTNLYVVYDEVADAVKIGTTRTPRARASNLGVGNPNPVELIVAVPAPAGLEQILHDLLIQHRLRGEWFDAADPVLVLCELLLSARDFQRDLERDERRTDPDLTVEVLCSRANELLDAAVVAA